MDIVEENQLVGLRSFAPTSHSVNPLNFEDIKYYQENQVVRVVSFNATSYIVSLLVFKPAD